MANKRANGKKLSEAIKAGIARKRATAGMTQDLQTRKSEIAWKYLGAEYPEALHEASHFAETAVKVGL